MGLETATSIAALNALWPLGTDPRSQGDDHLRLIKSVMKSDAVSRSAAADQALSSVLRAQAFVVGRNGSPAFVHLRMGGDLQTGFYAYSAQNAIYAAVLGEDAARIDGPGVGAAFETTVMTREKTDARYARDLRLSGGFTVNTPSVGWNNSPDGGMITSLYFNSDGVCTAFRGVRLQQLKGSGWINVPGGF